MMKSVVGDALLFLMLLLIGLAKGTHFTPPAKPKLTSCRSPEKETFTCWWEPGSDGGLPTTYALFYHKENSDTAYECPDYHTAGENSCFFNKNDTSIWVNYNITVVATNALGSNFSDPVDVDVVYIVQPHTPENVSVAVIEDEDGPFLRVSWEPPRKADTRSGWITLIYELRVKLEGDDKWEEHRAGQQKMFNIFSLRSGGAYLVQVRCKPDHGFWSEWSSTTYIKVPDYIPRERSMGILIATLSVFIFLILTWMLNIKCHSVKHCLLPPVPGPKIKGFDKQLLKNGRSEEIFSALVVPGFPPTTSPDYEELVVGYLEVYAPEEQELMLEENKDPGGCLKSKDSPSDSDSGWSSCDSHTLMMERCGDAKEEEREKEEKNGTVKGKQSSQTCWEEGEVNQIHEDMVSPDMSNERVKTWPCFSPLPQYNSTPSDQQCSLDTTKHLYFSDSLFPPSSSSSHTDQLGYSTKEGLALRSAQWDCHHQSHQLHPQIQPQQPLQALSNFNIPGIEHKQVGTGLQLPFFRSMEYVEVQRVNQNDMVLLQPLSTGHGQKEGHSHTFKRGDYSKVKGVDSGNMLLLQRAVEVMEEERDRCPCDSQVSDGETESCYTTSTADTTQMSRKPTVCILPPMTLQEDMALAANGYVDTATMLTT
ncbi:prolactin receptor a [Lampris incognitus]|uniref:prolactin receptor a n=1 Tax=Lampris incognitus TaxID=2546036 RepID=UPI0024B50D2B|nr:prolactin receptor a [Lampris incognitus]